MAKKLLKYLLHKLFGDYQYWKVYYVELPVGCVALPAGVTVKPISGDTDVSPDQGVRDRIRWYSGGESEGYALYVQGTLVAIQWCVWGQRYLDLRKGRSWHLPEETAKSLGLYTLPGFRGRGYAVLLKQHVAFLMSERGFARLYCRIWHSHHSSIRVTQKAGWNKAGSYVELYLWRKRVELRLPI